MCIADNIEMMTCICEVCKCEEAVFTYYKGRKDTDIMVGDAVYVPVCRECYNKLMNSNFSKAKKLVSRKHEPAKVSSLGKILVNDFSYQCHF